MSDKTFDELIKLASTDLLNESSECDLSAVKFKPTYHHKIKMNRLFREQVGGKFLPYLEVDNIFEKIRSWIVIKLHRRKS